MRALIVCTLLLLWAAPALAAQKSAPDGFGPIKFGMTKDEAWQAIGGQGEWVEDVLVHKVGLPAYLEREYEVRHSFRDGRADYVDVQNSDSSLSFAVCVTQIAYILGTITSKYGIYPIEVDAETASYPLARFSQVSIYQFSYRDSSFVQATLIRKLEQHSRGTEEHSCTLNVHMSPPQEYYSGGF